MGKQERIAQKKNNQTWLPVTVTHKKTRPLFCPAHDQHHSSSINAEECARNRLVQVGGGTLRPISWRRHRCRRQVRWRSSFCISLHSVSRSTSGRVPLERRRMSRAHARRIGRSASHPVSTVAVLTWIVRRSETGHGGGSTRTRGELSWMARRRGYRVAELISPDLSRRAVLTGRVVPKPSWTARRRGR